MATLSAYPTAYSNLDDTANDLYAFTRLENIDNSLDNANTTDYSINHMAKSSSASLTSRISMLSFDFSALPDDATINSVTIAVKYRVYSTVTCTGVEVSAFSGNNVMHGERISLPYSTTYKIDTVTSTIENLGTWTPADVKTIGVDLYAIHNLSNTNCYFYLWGVTVTVDYDILPAPTITIGTPSKSKISRVSGHDQATVSFRSDIDLQSWEARATLPGVTTGHGVGLLVESGSTLLANTDATVIVDDEELTNGDNNYTITVYGQSTEGVWSN